MRSTPIDERLCNPYLAFMARKHIVRTVACAVLSLFLIACMVTAPLCVARCAAPLCDPVSSGPSADTCHHVSQANGEALIFTAVAKKACATGELVFTPPRMEPLSASALIFVAPVSLDLLNVAAQSIAANMNAPSMRLSVSGSSPSVPLRI